jgi:hypothetical protein
MASIRSEPTRGRRRPTARTTRTARVSPRVNAITIKVAAEMSTKPSSAVTTYTGWKPPSGIETNSATHSSRFSTTADPRDALAQVAPASAPSTPDSVSNR